jgi:photosystem II stability/assembly factor-like uncharacterized protein
MKTLLVSTRKGLFVVARRGPGDFAVQSTAFLGDVVSLALADPRDGALYACLALGHFGVKLHRSRDQGATWQELAAPAFPPMPEGTDATMTDGRPWPWRVEQIWALEAGHASQPGRLWCGTVGGGLFRSDDHGATWSLVTALWDHPGRKAWFGGGADLPGIHSICVHPTDPKRLVVGVSCGGVWHSYDDGASFSLSAKGMTAEYMPEGRQEDEGIQDPHRLVQCAADPRRVWAQHHNGIFRSDDGGESYVRIHNDDPSDYGFAVAVHPEKPDTAWFVPMQTDAQRRPVDARVVVTRTDDAGKTFVALRDGLPQEHAYDVTYRHALDVAGDGETLAFGTTTGSLFVSEDGGARFVCVSTHLPPIYAVRFVG